MENLKKLLIANRGISGTVTCSSRTEQGIGEIATRITKTAKFVRLLDVPETAAVG